MHFWKRDPKHSERETSGPTFPDEDLKDLASLVFTASAIEQADMDPQRMTRMQHMSQCGSIMNHKLKTSGQLGMNDWHLYEKIERENSRKQGLQVVDHREATRVNWL